MIIGCVWVIASVATHALSNAMNDFAHTLIFGEKQYSFVKEYVIAMLRLLALTCVVVLL